MADSWKDAYAIRGSVMSRGLRAENAKAAELSASDISMADLRNMLKKSSQPVFSAKPAARTNKPVNAASGKTQAKYVAPKTEVDGESVLDKPVIKQFLDLISVGTYATSNYADNFTDAGIKFMGGDKVGGAVDALTAPVRGLGEGISAAFGNQDNVKTGSDVIKRYQALGGVDTESDESQKVSGIAGIGADIFLDPTTYATLGIAPLIKGGLAGAKMGTKAARTKVESAAQKALSEGVPENQVNATIRNSTDKNLQTYDNPLQGLLQGSGKEYKDWRARRLEYQNGKAETRRLNKTRVAAPINPTVIGEDIAGTLQRPKDFAFSVGNDGVVDPRKTVIPQGDRRAPIPARQEKIVVDEAGEATKIVDDVTEDLLDTVDEVKPQLAIEAPKGEAPKVAQDAGLSKAEKIVEALAKMTPTAPKYSTQKINQLNALRTARPDKITTKVPKPKAAPKSDELPDRIKVGDYEIDLDAFVAKVGSPNRMGGRRLIQMKNKAQFPASKILNDWNKADLAGKQKIANAIEPGFFGGLRKSDEGDKVVEADALDDILDDGFDMVEVDNPNKLNPEDFINKGMDPNDMALVDDELRALTAIIDTSKNTADTRKKLAAYINSDRISEDEFKVLQEITGGTTKAEVATAFTNDLKELGLVINRVRNPKAPRTRKEKADLTQEIVDEDIRDVARELTVNPTAHDAMASRWTLLSNYDRVVDETRLLEKGDDIVALSDELMAAVVNKQTRTGKANTRTKKGYDSDTNSIADGGAWHQKRWNSMHTITLHKEAISHMQRYFGGPEAAAKISSTARYQVYKQLIKVTDAKLRANGVQPYLSLVGDIKGARAGENLSWSDILQETPSAVARDAMFWKGGNSPGAFEPSQIMGAVEEMMRGKSIKLSDEEITRRMKDWLVAPNKKAGAGVSVQKRQIDRLVGKEKEAVYSSADKFIAKLMSPEVYHNLSIRKLMNSVQHSTKVGEFIADLTDEALGKLKSATNADDFIRTMNDELMNLSKTFEGDELSLARKAMDVKLADLVAAHERKAIDRGAKMAKTTKVSPQREAEVQANARRIQRDGSPASDSYGSKNPSKPNSTTAAKKNASAKAADAEETVATALKNEQIQPEPFEVIGAEIAVQLVRDLHPIQKFFNPRLGIDSTGIYRAMNSGLHTVARMQNEFHDSLLRHMKQYGNDTMRADLKFIQRQQMDPDISKIRFETQSQKDLHNVVTLMFGTSGNNIFERLGIGPQHFNKLADVSGLNPKWRFDPDLNSSENSVLWREWDGIDNVPDFLSRMHSVVVRASQDIAIAGQFSRKFGSIQRQPGYMKITRSMPGQNKDTGMYELIDTELYYPPEIAQQFAAVDRMMKDSRSVSTKTPFGKFIVNVFDPLTNALKASQTTVRPGHWVLSIIGDSLRNQLAGVNTLKPYARAYKIMVAGGMEFKEMSAIARYGRSQQLNAIPVDGVGEGVGINIGGRLSNVSYESLYKIFEPVVQLPPHRGGVMEDVLENEITGNGIMAKIGTAATRATDAVVDNQAFGGKASLNNLAAKRDNFMRLTLAIDFASKRRWKSVEEMKAATEDYVTKWAPTSTDFTAAEAKYGRRSLLYYTWLRGITPRIVETALMKPGATTAVPKALYGLAEANGLDPMSIGNPFPEEGLFPDYYMKNVLGPQWKDEYGMWGINPSSPVIEVMNTFGGISATDPAGSAQFAAQSVAGMATPFLRMPAEMTMGTQSNGIPIKDNMQYLGDNLGGSYLSTLSRATGKTINENGIVDRVDSAAKNSPEDQEEHAKLQAFNFLTGLKLTDYQSDSAIKSAAYSMQEKAREEGQRMMRSQ